VRSPILYVLHAMLYIENGIASKMQAMEMDERMKQHEAACKNLNKDQRQKYNAENMTSDERAEYARREEAKKPGAQGAGAGGVKELAGALKTRALSLKRSMSSKGKGEGAALPAEGVHTTLQGKDGASVNSCWSCLTFKPAGPGTAGLREMDRANDAAPSRVDAAAATGKPSAAAKESTGPIGAGGPAAGASGDGAAGAAGGQQSAQQKKSSLLPASAKGGGDPRQPPGSEISAAEDSGLGRGGSASPGDVELQPLRAGDPHRRLSAAPPPMSDGPAPTKKSPADAGDAHARLTHRFQAAVTSITNESCVAPQERGQLPTQHRRRPPPSPAGSGMVRCSSPIPSLA
jgi:hypothetical protein